MPVTETVGPDGAYCDEECQRNIGEKVAEHLEEGELVASDPGASAGSCSCIPFKGKCGRCSVKGIPQIIYAVISFFVTGLVLIIVLVDMTTTQRFSATEVLSGLLFIIALWSPSPGQPLLDKNKKSKK